MFAIPDLLAIGAIKAITDRRVQVPKDVSVIGIDGLEISAYLNPALITFEQPVEKMAQKCVRRVFRVIEGRGQNRHLVMPIKLPEGGSVKALTK